MTKTEEPVRTPCKAPFDGYEESHPAYAQIGASRVNSNHKVLYGSDFNHHNFVTIKIQPSTKRRDLSRDWHHTKRLPYIEVALSESQWATFVSSLNCGDGVPCTVETLNGVDVPQLPEILPDRKNEFSDEIRQTLADARKSLGELEVAISEMKISEKQRKELISKINLAKRDIGSSVKFVQDKFGEFMEDTTEKAKTEINAYVNSAITRAGLAAIQGQSPISLIDDSKKK